MSSLKAKLARLRPWDRLGIPRRNYEAARPWKKAGMERQQFESLLDVLPDQFVSEVKREAEAEKLVKAIFGKE